MDSETSPELQSWLVNVSGLVQGVNYRRFVQTCANQLGLRGWVRNEFDGSVSALLQHESRAVLELMLEQMREGSAFCEVESLKMQIAGNEPAHAAFEILR